MSSKTSLSTVVREDSTVTAAWRLVATVNICAHWLFFNPPQVPIDGLDLWAPNIGYATFLLKLNEVLVNTEQLSLLFGYLRRKCIADVTLEKWSNSITYGDTLLSTIGTLEDADLLTQSLQRAALVLNARP
jgi:hypothetical protein